MAAWDYENNSFENEAWVQLAVIATQLFKTLLNVNVTILLIIILTSSRYCSYLCTVFYIDLMSIIHLICYILQNPMLQTLTYVAI